MLITAILNLDALGITLISVAAALVVVGIIFLCIFLNKRRYRTTSQSLKTAYEDYHTQLTTDCQNMVKRLGVLSKSNSYFSSMYAEKQKQYEDILNKRDGDVKKILSSLDELVASKNYKGYKEVESEAQQAVADFEQAVCNFNSDLTSILQDDNDIHNNSVTVKAKYREIRQFYNDHLTELKPLEKSFDKVFTSAEKGFSQFDDCSNNANFDEAKKVLDNLDKLFTAILDVINDLPLLEVSVSNVLPKKLDYVMSEYQKMVSQGFIVSFMHVEDKVASMKDQVNALQQQLMVMDIRNVKEGIDDIQKQITDILAGFEEERKAKEIYFSRQNSLADSSFSVEKRYARMINLLPAYQKAFVLDDKYVQQMKSLRVDIESIGILKRELDSYLDTSARQPYIVITRKMNEMDSEMNKVITVMDDYESYLKSLKEDSSKVFEGLRDCYLQLKHAQNIVRYIDVASYTAAVKSQFTSYYQTIQEINKIVLTQPIDVPLAREKFNPFQESVKGFIAGINQTKEEAEHAETSLVYANAYRQDYTDSRAQLAQAEQAFMEADFNRASTIALGIVKMYSLPSTTTAE